MLVVEFDFLFYLSQQWGVSLKEIDDVLKKLNPLIIHGQNVQVPLHYTNTIVFNQNAALASYEQIAKRIVEVSTNQEEIIYLGFKLLPAWTLFDHLQAKQKIHIPQLTLSSFLKPGNTPDQMPLYLDHAEDFWRGVPKEPSSFSFMKLAFHQASTHLTEKVFVNNQNEERTFTTFTDTDAVIFSTATHALLPSYKDQDISVYLYNSFLTLNEGAYINKALLEDMTAEEVALLKLSPPDFFLKKAVNILSSLRTVENGPILLQDHFAKESFDLYRMTQGLSR